MKIPFNNAVPRIKTGIKKNKVLYAFLALALLLSSSYVVYTLTDVHAENASWPMTTESNYTYDTDKIELIGGVAQLLEEVWYDNSFGYRKQITIDRSKIPSGNLAYFPVLINTTDTDLKDTTNGGNVGQSDGGDIVFTARDKTTKLDFEKESYTSSTGALTYWVEVPAVNGTGATTDTVIYMYYGSSTIADQWDMNATWNEGGAATGFQVVHHLQETDIDGGVGDIKDSTSNGNNVTTTGMDTNDQVAGQVNGSFAFDGINDFLDGSLSQTFNTFTASMWIKPGFAYNDASKHLNRLFVLSDGSKTITALYNTIQDKFIFTNRDDSSAWVNTGNLSGVTKAYALIEGSDGALYAGTGAADSDVFKSTNGGDTWATTGDIESDSRIYALIESSNGTLYAGTATANGDVFKSTDDGDTWANTGDLASATRVYSLLEGSDGALYAGTYPNGNVFKSTDDGDTWSNTGNLSSASSVYYLMESSNGTIYAGTAPNGDVFKSTNGGDSWTNTGNLSGANNANFVFEASNGTLYVGTSNSDDFFKSTNGGTSWTSTALSVSQHAMIEASNGTLYVGTSFPGGDVFKSTDNGNTWTNTGNLSGAYYAYSLLEASDGSIYAGIGNGGDVFKMSSDVLTSTAQTFVTSTWMHLNFQLGASEKNIFIDGAEDATTAYAFGGLTAGRYLLGGDYLSQKERVTSTYFNGTIDELTFSDSERSDGWTTATYNNQKYPDKDDHSTSGFYTVGAEAASSTTVLGYPTDSPTVVNSIGLTFKKNVVSLSETLASDSAGSVTYQISNDGTNWYYYDGTNWVSATGVAQSNAASVLDTNLITLVDDVGLGDFYFKAFLTSNGSQFTKLDAVTVPYDITGGGGSVSVQISDPIATTSTPDNIDTTSTEPLDEEVVIPTTTPAAPVEEETAEEEVLEEIIEEEEEKPREVTIKEPEIYGPYLGDYILFGDIMNDSESVKKLKRFLNDYEGESLDIDAPAYDRATFEAVVRFQEKYSKYILEPWGITRGTGYVYITTLKQINYLITH